MEYYSVNGYLKAAAGHEEELLNYLLEAATEMENVEDCLIYSVGLDPLNPDHIYIYEVWKNEAAHQNSLQLDVFRNLIDKAKPIIVGMEDLPKLTIKGGKGIK